MKIERLPNVAITVSGAVASGIFLASVAVCVGTTTTLFLAAPFVPDRVERQIQRPILPSAAGIVGSLACLGAIAAIASRGSQDQDIAVQTQRHRYLLPTLPADASPEPEQSSPQAKPTRFVRTCMNCFYLSEDVFLQPCAVHPGCSISEAAYCRDFKLE